MKSPELQLQLTPDKHNSRCMSQLNSQFLGVLLLLMLVSVMTWMVQSNTNYLEFTVPASLLTKIASAKNSSAGKKEILLLSYGRSGSSFTSAVISYHRDVFYVFEPLNALEFTFEKYFINKYEFVSKEIINDYFTCQLLMKHLFVFKDKQLRNSPSTAAFYDCFRSKLTGYQHLSCFYQLVKSCQDHKVILLKTIRFSVKWTEFFLKEHPNFKLLLLVRDPRATLYSQSVVFQSYNWRSHIDNVSAEHCRRLEEDLLAAERLRRLFPRRVKGIRYEDGATDPFQYTRAIYEFLGLDYNRNVIEYVAALTNASSSNTTNTTTTNPYSLRRNSAQAMSQWRKAAGYPSVQVVDRNCGHLYAKLGYRFVESARDLNSSISLVTSPEPGGIF